MSAKETPRRIAVIGSGVAGLTAAYALREHAEVTLYEQDSRLGGHAHTHDVVAGGRTLAVDSGFIVHNESTYPNLIAMFAELGVATRPTEMSMSVSCRGCGLEYCGARGAAGLFGRRRNAVSARYLAMLAQIPLFHRRARALLASGEEGPSLGDFVRAGGHTRYFTRHFVVPLVSAVWSCGPGSATDYPASYLFRFLANHGMLSIGGSPRWRTVVGGSRTYVERIAKQIPAVRTMTPVRAVCRPPGRRVEVHDDADGVERFDSVVIATHADQALTMLPDADDNERAVLGAFEYARNDTLLHTDDSVLPPPRVRGSWNYLLPSCDARSGGAQVSYDLDRLQGLDSPTPMVVTLGGSRRVRPDSVVASMSYEHPVYTHRSVAAQRRLPGLNTGVTAFAGAYHGWGFHEDGCRSGLAAAEALLELS
ncbi:FAD-dependent oxidoreductase [Phytomonospora sp. NPDC050363]|uniref:NAD(P)/FAD-dependent oxidoreductase n=1 Tax=Phytomonospora sp. NPDC050363 TaxID=3155642 RepID=UPI0033D40A60